MIGDPHLQARDFIQVILKSGFDPIFVDGDCRSAERLPKKLPGPAPRQGEHTLDIARQVLGLTDERSRNW